MQVKTLRKGLFLDRDGVVNINNHYIADSNGIEFISGIFELCSWAHSEEFLIVIVTNQSGIGRGLFTMGQYNELTNWILTQFSIRGCVIDLVVTSPIDPNDEKNSEAVKFRRKPLPGMILDACEILSIDPGKSVLIGDSESDIEAGMAAGIPTLIRIAQSMPHTRATHCFTSIESLLDVKEVVIK